MIDESKKMEMTLQEIADMLPVAKRNGTLEAFAELLFQWAWAANTELAERGRVIELQREYIKKVTGHDMDTDLELVQRLRQEGL